MLYVEYVFLFVYGKLKINEDIKREVGSKIARQKVQYEKELDKDI